MTFEEKLTNQEYDRIWQEYCGFLDLDLESYMKSREGFWRSRLDSGAQVLLERRF